MRAGTMDTNYLEFSFGINGIDIEARVDYSNRLRNIKASSFEPHSHTMYEVYFVENGWLSAECMQEKLELREHGILVIMPNTEHRVVACSDNAKRLSFRFLFREPCDVRQENAYFLYAPQKSIENNIFQNIEAIHLYFRDRSNKLNSFRIKNSFGTVMSYIAEQLLPGNVLKDHLISERSDTLTQRIRIDQFFAENYCVHTTIDDLAAALNYSPTHVNRLLKKYTGMTFSQNLSSARVDAAKKLLKTTKLSIADIAYQCGFHSVRGFELFFGKKAGLSPVKFRKG